MTKLIIERGNDVAILTIGGVLWNIRLYSGNYFQPHQPQPVSQNAVQRTIFFIGLQAMFLHLPLTVPIAFNLMKKVPR